MNIKHLAAAAAVFMVLGVSNAHAVVIGFDPLTGNNGDAYAGHTEVGFDIVSTSGDWQEGHAAGNPVPSIFTRSDTASITVTRSGGGLFSLSSVDFNNGTDSRGPPTYDILGTLGAVTVIDLMGDIPPDFGSPIASGTSALIDTLVITVSLNGTTSANIDNIDVDFATVLPAPGVIGLVCIGLAGLGFSRRRSSPRS